MSGVDLKGRVKRALARSLSKSVLPLLDNLNEAFEKCSISFKIKAHENFDHRNISDISRIKIRMQRRDWAKEGILQRSHNARRET